MRDPYTDLYLEEACLRTRMHSRASRQGMLRLFRSEAEDGFMCKRCGSYVSSALALAGVLNRNHCPYCLWSRHVDLYQSGDRLCACKELMRPIGLTRKQTRKKYGPTALGELMLVHACTGCPGVSINRLAADDDAQVVMRVFDRSLEMDASGLAQLAARGIQPLGAESRSLVERHLFGNN
ncbi:MAG: RNHCP domain-containing protein [Chloroflexi bacterium]|nr:RNHCP domain-containing protein [Chloroflexota bacterium]